MTYFAGPMAYFTAEGMAHNVITSSPVDITVEQWQDVDGGRIPDPGEEAISVMPGDRLEETIELKNSPHSGETIKLYMKVAAHDGAAGTMADSLRQLTMRIYNGSKLIYEASPEENGALASSVLLGQLRHGGKLRWPWQISRSRSPGGRRKTLLAPKRRRRSRRSCQR